MEQMRAMCEWTINLKLPNNYTSNWTRFVDMREGNMSKMKNHDCYVFME